jgi:uncharacterized membrane protein
MTTTVAISLLVSACNYSIDKKGAANQEGLIDSEKARLRAWDYVSESVFAPRCVVCHGSAGGINVETYENVIKNLASIRQATLVEKSMPKNSFLNEKEEAILSAWIASGAPNNNVPGPGPDPTPQPPVLAPEFESLKANIFVPRCISCHSVSGSVSHIPLLTKSDFLDSPRELVIPGNADESGVVLFVERDDEKRMPPPETGSGLTAEEKRVLREWIQNGASD